MVKETIADFKEALSKLNDKNDNIIDLIHKIDNNLSKINHDLYGNGRPGLFEEFNSFKENEFLNLKKSVHKIAKIVGNGLAIISFLYCIPLLKEVIKIFLK